MAGVSYEQVNCVNEKRSARNTVEESQLKPRVRI